MLNQRSSLTIIDEDTDKIYVPDSKIQDACGSMKVDTLNHQDASGSMKVNISNHQEASGSMKVDTSNHQVAFPETQCLTSFITPRKRNFQSDSNQWRISTRQKFCDDGHIPTRDASEV